MKFKGSKKLGVKVAHIHETLRKVGLKELFLHGFIHCDISRYEDYTIIELVREFCSVVPCFFKSYDDLYSHYTADARSSNIKMVEMLANFLTPPIGQYQAHAANIIHRYFLGLPWIN